ncbi:protein bax [Chromohalobacter japonicus]|uniref:protein bax n=1 Tax=Chromohalobacter japonicus TaxID=223900 RepID=UPI001FF66FAF|nr:protein bax [Chromohalobacter japonicus]MCK0751936.1 protein bax [Chromohalobacter japonicus]
MPIRHDLFFSRRWRGVVAAVLLGALGVTVTPPPLDAHAASPSRDVRTLESNVDTPALDPVEEMPDLREYAAGPERKTEFLELLVPLIEAENAKIQAQRDWLTDAREHQDSLSDAERSHLQRLCDSYQIECGTSNTFEYLLSRVDTLPLEMVVIQAVEESGWGTSRFARKGNNLFGLRCFSEGCGLAQRGSSRHYQNFDSVQASIEAYLHNLNTHRAYLAMRQTRATQNEKGAPVSAESLIRTLDSYSVRDNYFDVLLALLRTNAELIREHSSDDAEDSPA